MTVARILCGGCGETLKSGQSVCPQCGAAVEIPGESSERGRTAGPNECPSCGHVNVNPGAFCESCGTRVQSGNPAARKEPKEKRPNRKKTGSLHLPFIILVVLVGGWFVYDEWSRDIPPRDDTHVHAPGEDLHSTELGEIEALQRQVDANPDDDALLLRLANQLQDFAAHDRRLYVRAVENYKRYLERHPDEANPRVDLGICYYELSRGDTVHAGTLLGLAISEMETVFESNPDHQASAYNLGIVTLNAGWTDKSAEWFKKAVAINPTSSLGQRAQQLLEQHTFAGQSQ